MSSIDIEPSDVIKLIQQYLKENNLLQSLQCLQEETSVSLNTVDSIENFVNDINSGHWDVVLRTVRLLKLSEEKLFDLYEQIVIELIELREVKAANWLFSKTEPLQKLKSFHPDRYSRLQNLLARTFFDHNEAYRSESKERRRAVIAQDLKGEVKHVPPQRLLELIGDALKWQKHEGLLPSNSLIDIFTGKAKICNDEIEKAPRIVHKHCIKPVTLDGEEEDQEDQSIFVCCAEFTTDGQYLVVGYSTGLIEVRNSTTGRLAKDLKFQSRQHMRFMMTPNKSAALCLAFHGNDLLAVGDRAGDITVWRLDSGQLQQRFQSAHIKAISCVVFKKGARELLSGSHDTTVKLHGMRSNRTIREFRGHRSLVQTVVFSSDETRVVSGGSDFKVRIWNSKTGDEVACYGSASRIREVHLMPQFKSDIFLVCSRSNKVHLIDLEGKLRAKLTYQKPTSKTTKPKLASRQHNRDDIDQETEDSKLDEMKETKPVKQENEDDDQADENQLFDDNQEPEDVQFFSACSSPKGNWIFAVDSRHIYCFDYTQKKVVRRLKVHETKNNDLIGIKHHPLLNIITTFDTQGNLKLWKP